METSCLTPAMSSQRRLGCCGDDWRVLFTQPRCDWTRWKTNRTVTLHLRVFTLILRETIIWEKKEREKKLKHAICKYETSERSIRAVMGSPLTWTLLVVFVWFVVLWSGCNSRASIYSGFPAGQCIKGKTLNAAGYEAIGDGEELFYVALSGKCWRTSWSKHTTPCWHIQKRAYPKLRADRATQKVIDSKSSALMSIFFKLHKSALCFLFCFLAAVLAGLWLHMNQRGQWFKLWPHGELARKCESIISGGCEKQGCT